MTERDATDGGTVDDGGSGGRDLKQALVAVAVVVGLVTAAAMIPAMNASGPGGSGSGSGSGSGEGGTGGQANPNLGPGGGIGSIPGQPGALNPGQQTGVGSASTGGGVGSLGNLSNEVHFTVKADRAAYWRTGSFDRYTGSGWRQTGETKPYTGSVGASGSLLTQEVTLRQGATALPAAWKPGSIRFPNGDQPPVSVTGGGSFVVRSGVPEGTTYRVVSWTNDVGPERLREVGVVRSGDIARYTELPSTTPDRVERFTSDLTREADGAYETARMIELWLEKNKRYSLNASHDRSEPVADQFIFEMEKGYCEYFATSMVVMLRSQDIPARYVVGYAPGTRMGNGTYQVRAMDAHAWVEVYFKEVGWVRFDPTPAASRRATERSAQSPEEIEPRPIVPGSPGDIGGDGSIPPVPGGDGGQGQPQAPEQLPPLPYEVSLNTTPVPGSQVTATVTKDGRPIEGVFVTFEGERVGRTNRNGNVTATVPYVDDLTVSVEIPEGVSTGDGDGVRAGVEPDTDSAVGLSLGAVGAGTVATGQRGAIDRQEGDDDGDSDEVYDVKTDVSLRVEGMFAPGRTATIVATIDGVPVRNARVTFGGEYVGRTDRRGQVKVEVPASRRGTVAVGIERGEISETASLRLESMHVRLHPDTVVPLPGQAATVRVTVGDTPIPNAPVYLDGERIGTTDGDGTVRTTLPTANAVRIRAEGPVLSKTVDVSGLYLNLGALLASVLSLLVGLAVVVRRRAPDAKTAAGSVRSTLSRALAAIAGGLRWAVDAAISGTIVAGRYLQIAARQAVAVATTVASRVADVSYTAIAFGIVAGVAGGVRSALLWLRALPGRAWAWLLGLRSGGEGNIRGEGPRSGGTPGGDAADGRSLLSVRAAWRAFVRMVPLSRPETMTPGEIRRRAVEYGFPKRPVSRLTDAFRDVEYGGRDETERRREAAGSAYEQLQDDSRDRRGGGRRSDSRRSGGDD